MTITAKIHELNGYYEEPNVPALEELAIEAKDFTDTIKKILAATKSQDQSASPLQEFEMLFEKRKVLGMAISHTRNYLDNFRAQSAALLNPENRFLHLKEDHFIANPGAN